FQRGDDPGRAAPWWLRSAEQAFDGDDVLAALHRSERCVECGATGEMLGRVRALRAEACFWIGDRSQQEELARAALDLLVCGSDTWFDAAATLVLAHRGRSDLATYKEIVARLVAAPRGSGHVGRVAALVQAAIGFYDRSAFSAGDELLES